MTMMTGRADELSLFGQGLAWDVAALSTALLACEQLPAWAPRLRRSAHTRFSLQ